MTSYTYDVQNHISGFTDAEGNATTYTTSDRDLVTQEVSPVSGTTTYSYNEHGQRVEETDARAVTVTKTYDALDRVTFIDYPNYDDEDTTYTYDSSSVAFSKGRLTSIARGGGSINYAYDRFGRMTQDGALTNTYDKNGNVLTLGYPNGVTATYTYDFADRQSTLQMQNGTSPAQTLVSASSYKPLGPLASLTLGNGLTETHGYSTRYLPTSIGTDSFSYVTNASGGDTPLIDGYSYDEAGDVLTPSSGGDLLVSGGGGYVYGDDRRMSGNDIVNPLSYWSATYDGRGFLSEVLYPERAHGDHDSVQPTYSSAGLLLHRNFSHPVFFSGTATDLYIFYFASRPVATLENVSGTTSSSTLSYLSTDHLGTPILITNTSGSQVWQGGFEPFGDDYSGAPTILRLPGQWVEDNSGLYYNVNRWYASGMGRYTQPDPLGLEAGVNVYLYGVADPTKNVDPLGLRTFGMGGKACTDCSCKGRESSIPVQVKTEDGSSLMAIPPAGTCIDADGIYSSSGIVKVRDFGKCWIVCAQSGAHAEARCNMVPPWPSFWACKGGHQSKPGPDWPDNPFCS